MAAAAAAGNQLFTPNDVLELHYITSIEHVASILKKGIWSHDKCHKLRKVDVSDNAVQERRAQIEVPRAVQNKTALKVHGHAVLYFNAHNGMMHNIIFKQQKSRDSLCVLRVSAAILQHRHAMVSDQNASTNAVSFQVASRFSLTKDQKTAVLGPASLIPYDLRNVLEAIRPDKDWQTWYRQTRQAEVLVPYNIPSNYILGAYVNSEQAQLNFIKVTKGYDLDVKVYPKMFYPKGDNEKFARITSEHRTEVAKLKQVKIVYQTPPNSPPATPEPDEEEQKDRAAGQ